MLYLILVSGGFLNAFGFMASITSLLSGAIMIGLSIFAFYHYLFVIRLESNEKQLESGKFIIYSVFVIISSWAVEYLGVETGVIFGSYFYGDVLQPQTLGVPIAIGFAWLSTLLSSAAMFASIGQNSRSEVNIILKSLAVAALMVLLDYFLEPVATRLGYWSWADGIIPLRNYVAWFLLSFFYAYLGYQLRIFTYKMPKMLVHVYITQVIFFVIIILF